MDRENLLKLWDESWSDGIWFGSWSKSISDLSAEQAAWHPEPGLHSIWQLVEHVNFWREDTLGRLAGRAQPDADEVARRNFPTPQVVSEDGWRAVRERLEQTHRAIRAAIADEGQPLDRLRYHLAHDANHLGQILYLRRMLGLSPVE